MIFALSIFFLLPCLLFLFEGEESGKQKQKLHLPSGEVMLIGDGLAKVPSERSSGGIFLP